MKGIGIKGIGLTRKMVVEGESLSYTQRMMHTKPIAYWPLNELTGTAANNYGSIVAGNGTYSGPTLAQIAAPGEGLAPQWDGIDDKVDGYSAALAIAMDFQLGSIAFWWKVQDDSVWLDGEFRQMLWIFPELPYITNYIQCLKLNSNRFIEFTYKAGGIISSENTSLYGYDTDWHFTVMTFNLSANEWKVYTDGIQMGITHVVGTFEPSLVPDSFNIGMGGYPAAGIEVWKGYLAHYAIWDRVLTLPEILSLYNFGLPYIWRHFGTFKVEDYGTVGDGIEDDTEAIQRAVNAATDCGGGIIKLRAGDIYNLGHSSVPGGTYPLPGSEPVGCFIDCDDIVFEGPGTIFLTNTAVYEGLLFAQSMVSPIIGVPRERNGITGVTFDWVPGTVFDGNMSAFSFFNCRNFFVTACSFPTVGTLHRIGVCWGDRGLIDYNVFGGNHNSIDMWLDGIQNSNIRHNTLTNGKLILSALSDWQRMSDYNVVEDNVIGGGTFKIGGGTGNIIQDNIIGPCNCPEAYIELYAISNVNGKWECKENIFRRNTITGIYGKMVYIWGATISGFDGLPIKCRANEFIDNIFDTNDVLVLWGEEACDNIFTGNTMTSITTLEDDDSGGTAIGNVVGP